MSKIKLIFLLSFVFGIGAYIHLQSQKRDTMRANFLIIVDKIDAAVFGYEQTFAVESLLFDAERQRDFTSLHRDNLLTKTAIPKRNTPSNDTADLHAELRDLIDHCDTGEITTYTAPHPMALQCEGKIEEVRIKLNKKIDTSLREAVHIATYLEEHDEGLVKEKENRLCDVTKPFLHRNARNDIQPIKALAYYFKYCHTQAQIPLFSKTLDARLAACVMDHAQDNCIENIVRDIDFESLPQNAFK